MNGYKYTLDINSKGDSTTLDKSNQTIQIKTVEYSQVINAMTLMKGCRNSISMHKPNCLLISGQSRTGKSTLIAHYLRTVLSTKGILAMNMPVPATFKSVISAIYEKLGYGSDKGESNNEAVHLVQAIKEKEIGMIIIDDFERVMDSNNNRINYDVLNLLKDINESAQVSIIAVGLPISKMIVQQNLTLGRLFSFYYEIQPFNNHEKAIKEFKRFLQKVEKQLPIEPSIPIENDEFIKQLIHITDGLVDKVVLLVSTAANFAMMKGEKRISKEHFAVAYKTLFKE